MHQNTCFKLAYTANVIYINRMMCCHCKHQDEHFLLQMNIFLENKKTLWDEALFRNAAILETKQSLALNRPCRPIQANQANVKG